MKTKISITLALMFIGYGLFSQSDYTTADFTIKSKLTFDIKSDYRKSNTTEDADVIIFKISVTNISDTPIPDLGATQRSEHLNLIINDSINNPISLYNGVEIIGDHLLLKGQSDTYEWWIYADDAYGEEFTVQWQYLDAYSETFKVFTKTKEIIRLKSKPHLK